MIDYPMLKTESDRRRLRKWHAHLATRGTEVPEEPDFQSFGRLSTLERLRDVLSVEAPHHCAPLARVISQLKREKSQREKPRHTTTSRPGPTSDLSVGIEELPHEWKVTLKEMRRRREDLDGGMIDLGDTEPPAQSQIRATEYVLRCIAKVCIEADRSVNLDTESVRLWLERQEARGQRETGLAMQLRKLAEFLIYRDEKSKLRKAICGLQKYRTAITLIPGQPFQ